jgi:excisionase family DNA binding protein
MTDTNTSPELLNLAEVQRLLNIGRTSVYQLMASGALPSVKIGRRTLFARKDVDAFVDRLRESAAA